MTVRKVLKPIVREYRPGKFREIHVLVEVDEHPAAMRELIEEQLRRRLREEVSIEELVLALYRYMQVVVRAIAPKLAEEDARTVADIQRLFERVEALRITAHALKVEVAEAKREELAAVDVVTDATWTRGRKEADQPGQKDLV